MTRNAATPLGFSTFARTLVEHKVNFVVCGGIACALQGVQRGTQDLDICVTPDDQNMQRLVDAAKALGMRPRFPEPLESIADSRRRLEWVETKHAMVITLISDATPLQMDVFLNYPIPFEELAARANRMSMGDVSFLVSSREDLLRAKQMVNPPRKEDLRDIEDLKDLLARERRS